jgi:glutathione S-transferase
MKPPARRPAARHAAKPRNAKPASDQPRAGRPAAQPGVARLIISSRNYSSWSLRGFLLTRLSGLPFTLEITDDAGSRAELLMRSSSIRVPCLVHDGLSVWDTLAIAEYLNELRPKAGMLPAERIARARCRSIAGEIHSGFSALRSALPMNLRARMQPHAVWSGARADIEAVMELWRGCLEGWHGPFLFGDRPTIADAMYAPVVTRFITYGVAMDPLCAGYAARIMALPDMQEWIAAASEEIEEVAELEMDF